MSKPFLIRAVLCLPVGALLMIGLVKTNASPQDGNRIEDPSFESAQPRDQFGRVFPRWGGFKYEGDCEFQVGAVARRAAS